MLGVANGAILVPLNTTMLAVALPGIMDEFRLGANEVSSLVTLYLGAVAVTLPVGGALGDRFGHRITFLLGVLAFAAASLVAALATSFEVLQAGRVAQAGFGALISTSSASLIRMAAPADRQGEAFGLFDLLVSISAAIGPFVGGLLVGAFGWRSLFFVAVPVGLLAAVLVGFVLGRRRGGVEPPTMPAHPGRRLDVVGLVVLAATIVAFVVALPRDGPGELNVLAALALGPLLLAFVVLELRRKEPAVDPRLFLHAPFAAAVTGVFASTIVLHGCFLVVPLLVEELLLGSPTTSGFVLLGIAGVSALVAPLGGRASDRLGRRWLAVAGGLVMAVGLAGLATPAGTGSTVAVGLWLGVVGLGFGIGGAPRQAAAFDSIEAGRVGMAAGTYFTGRYLGGVVGASLGGSLLGSVVTHEGVTSAFVVLTVVALAVVVLSFGLPAKGGHGPAEAKPIDTTSVGG
jgi:EmrB/QacA subfamily drug resistance transporter